MKNLIYQYLVLNDKVNNRGNVGDKNRIELYKEIANVSRMSFEKYAEYHGFEYEFCEEPYITKESDDHNALFFECLRVIYDESYDQYDKILFLDCDVVCNSYEDIFSVSEAEVYGVYESDIVTESKGGYNVWDFHKKDFLEHAEKWEAHGCPIVPVISKTNRPSRIAILNTGVIVWTRQARIKARECFDDWREWLYGEPKKSLPVMLDQPWINAQLMKYDFDVEGIGQTWNDTPTHYKNPENKFRSNFLHYTGGNGKTLMLEDYAAGNFKILENL